jgi:ankyrin repeat protein
VLSLRVARVLALSIAIAAVATACSRPRPPPAVVTKEAPPTSSPDGPDADLLLSLTLGEPPRERFPASRFESALARGANVDAVDDGGNPALLLAVIAHAYLAETHPDKAPLLGAIRKLLERGADPNAANRIGRTSLMMATHRAHTGAIGEHPVPPIKPVFDLLLAAHADIRKRAQDDGTALHFLARWQEDAELLRLVRLGADPLALDKSGASPFSLLASAKAGAATLGAILDTLPEAKRASIVAESNAAGTTPLISAVRAGNVEATELLLDRFHVDPNVRNNADETALTIANEYARTERTPPDLARRYVTIAALLEKHGARVPERKDSCSEPLFEPITVRGLRETVARCKITSIDALVALLPRERRASYVLAYKTGGLQEGSPAHPRVITFAGRLFLSFNGDAAQKGHDVIEMLELDPDRARFELHELEIKKGRATWHGPNPPQCLTCHGEEPLPIWDSWYLWPGFYRSEQGALYPKEAELHRQFEANMKEGRYRHLLRPSDAPVRLRLGRYDFSSSIKNIGMDALVQDTASDVFARRLAEEPTLRRYRYALLGALSCKTPIESFLPAPPPRSFEDLWAETRRLDIEELTNRVERHRANLPGAPEGDYALHFVAGRQKTGQSYETERVARLRTVVDTAGSSIAWASTQKEKQYYVIGAIAPLEAKLWRRVLGPEDSAIARIYEERFAQMPVNLVEWRGFFRGGDSETRDMDDAGLCERLRAASTSALHE